MNDNHRTGAEPLVTIELDDLPDFLGKAARVERVGALLQSGQEQIAGLRAGMIANCHEDGDPIPTPPPPAGQEPPDTETYGERIQRLHEGMAALWRDNEDIREDLTAEAVRRRKVVEKQIELRHEEELTNKR